MNIAIVGAGGAVGREFLKLLEGGALPVDNLRLFGSERSAGSAIPFRGKPVTIELLSPESDFSGVDFGGTLDNITYKGANIAIEEAGTYTLTVDFSTVPYTCTLSK